MSGPLVIGGTGGSGTRIVARIARLAGRYMGAELNSSEDAMPFARFDWKWALRYLERGSCPEMAAQFEEAVREHLQGKRNGEHWGWKHPHSYLLLPFLHERFPGMRFIHVVRDGRDIALSSNRQQANHYGRLLERPEEPQELRSAAWWAWANLRAREDGARLGDDYSVVRLEDLCAEPAASTQRIVEFGDDDDSLFEEVVKPPSLGRWRRQHDEALMGEIESVCGDTLRRFGYRSPE